ncbi:MAG: PEP-CTERM sorting domain-containing protein [Thermodesulfobacteriota bacterium]
MRRSTICNVLALLAILLWSSSAMAITLAPGFNTIEFVNWENRIKDGVNVGTDGPIEVGDIFYGIARVQTIAGTTPPDPFNSTSAPVHNLTAYFYTEVASLAPASDPNNLIINFGVPGASDPNGIISDPELASGVVFKLFEDFATNISFATEATSIATATDGALWMSLTLDGGYWWSEALGDPTGLTPGTFVGTSWFGLNTFFSSVGPLNFVNDPLEDLYDISVQLYAQSTIETNARVDGSVPAWSFTSDDPAVVATPEPATMLIMGSGLLGMFAARRRKKNT